MKQGLKMYVMFQKKTLTFSCQIKIKEIKLQEIKVHKQKQRLNKFQSKLEIPVKYYAQNSKQRF